MQEDKVLKINIKDKKSAVKVEANIKFNEHHIKSFSVAVWDEEYKVKAFVDAKKYIMKLSGFDLTQDKVAPKFSLFTKGYLGTYDVDIFEGLWIDYINQLYSAYEDSKLPVKVSAKDSIIIKKMLSDLTQAISTIGLAIQYKEYIDWMQRALRDTEKAKADVYVLVEK